jgi:hypothetical protein
MAVHLWGRAILRMIVGRSRYTQRITQVAMSSSATVLLVFPLIIVAPEKFSTGYVMSDRVDNLE